MLQCCIAIQIECYTCCVAGKKHYNEYYAVKMARQLMEDDEEHSEEDQHPDRGEKSKNCKSGSNSPMDTETKD